MGPRHFLDLDALGAPILRAIIDNSVALKGRRREPGAARPLAGKTLAMIFERPSTRTRVSFEVAMRDLGGDVVLLRADEMQLKRGETMADTARVLSRYVDAIMMRSDSAAKLNELAAHASVPVINGLTDRSHPCQVMADIMTFEEHRGPIAGRRVAWCGDLTNVCRSWAHAALALGFTLSIAAPAALVDLDELAAWRSAARPGCVEFTEDPALGVRGAALVLTDTWTSMNHDGQNRHNLLTPYQVNEALFAHAAQDALFMHCLPAHRGEEVTTAILDGPRSVVWDEAENRLHVQKGILAWCLA